jgi:hypothetical protein
MYENKIILLLSELPGPVYEAASFEKRHKKCNEFFKNFTKVKSTEG